MFVYNEKWVKDYEGLYSVDTEGKVYSWNYRGTDKKEQLKGRPNQFGYSRVDFYKSGRKKAFKVQRLVAETFIPNPKGEEQVNFLDGDKTNNAVYNLEWATNSENQLHAYRTGLKNSEGVKKALCKSLLQLDRITGELVAEYPSLSEAERQTGISKFDISKCCRGSKNYSHAGNFIWEFAV